jgi:hypothetical protein
MNICGIPNIRMFCDRCEFKFCGLAKILKGVYQILSYDLAPAWLPKTQASQTLPLQPRSYLAKLSLYTYLQNTELQTLNFTVCKNMANIEYQSFILNLQSFILES